MSNTCLYALYYVIPTRTHGRLPFWNASKHGSPYTSPRNPPKCMIFIPILIDNGHILSSTTENIHKCTCNEQTMDIGWNCKWNKNTIRLFLTAQSRGGKTPLRRAADQHFGRSEGDRGTGCWAELLGRRENRRGFEQPQKLNTWRQEITDQQLSITLTALQYPLLRKKYAPRIIRLLQDSVPKQKKKKLLLGYHHQHCACTVQSVSLNRLSFAFPSYKFYHCVWHSFFLDFLLVSVFLFRSTTLLVRIFYQPPASCFIPFSTRHLFH